jgi:hypothetical protein
MLSTDNKQDLKLIILKPHNDPQAFEVDAWLGDVCLGRRRFYNLHSVYAVRTRAIAFINQYGSLN